MKREQKKKSPTKLRVLVTGGPTRAYLDNVRFISNVSSGAVAREICASLIKTHADVALVAGPTGQPFEKMALRHYSPVETNDEMNEEVLRLCREFKPHVAIFSAAVLDFVPVKRAKGKVSSELTEWVVKLKPTKKIIDQVGRQFPHIKRVGFKLEWVRSKDKEGYAAAFEALDRKKLDAVCLNFLSEIVGDSHPAILITRDGEMQRAENKPQIALLITNYVTSLSL